ncbi:MAG: hypothetical protein EPO32_01245 [Anaerolineae bacterium]|nr:MAG: hypothetical protein EPO32_01245 [Anaerolineae bacterium]
MNPLEDVIDWITGLRSTGYTSDLLRTTHGFTDNARIKTVASQIATTAGNSVGLFEQAYSGPPEVSFLPLYYALLNLSKVSILASGFDVELARQKRHGSSYDPARKSSRDLINEKFEIWPSGVFPLFVRAITGRIIPRRFTISNSEIYPFVPGIGHEFGHAYEMPPILQGISIELRINANKMYCLFAVLAESSHPNALNLRSHRVLRGFESIERKRNEFQSRLVLPSTIPEDEAMLQLARDFPRYLLYQDTNILGELITATPISSKRELFPPEAYIWLAFFHLSSVVRYKPEFLEQLMDSKTWPTLLALTKHSVLEFIVMFWSFIRRANYHIIVR